MEGSRRVATVVRAVTVCAMLAVCGCGGSSSGSDDPGPGRKGVETRDPKTTFAPMVVLHPDETRMPAGARWFLERSALIFAEDQGCPDRKIAVGRILKEQRTPITNWLAIEWLGNPPAYWRHAHDAHCELRLGRMFYADQHTRPYDGGRPEGLGGREGWVLDLDDGARDGKVEPRRVGDRTLIEEAPVYVDQRKEEVDGEPGLRLTYWLLYGINEPRTADGIEEHLVHEGDWEGVDVLLQRSGTDAYVPVSLVLHGDGERREVPWNKDLLRAKDPSSGKATRPLLIAAQGSHTMFPGSGRSCEECPIWRTWREVAEVRELWWYGFGGAWGDVGPDSLTTGPLGPHGAWPSSSEIDARF